MFLKNFIRRSFPWGVLLICAGGVWSFQAVSGAGRIHRIQVKGHRIIQTPAVLAKISLKPGGVYRLSQVRKDVKNLFKTGWFSHIEVDLKPRPSHLKQVILTYRVRENPLVQKVSYKGNHNISKKEMDKLFSFSQYEFLNRTKIKQALSDLRKEYRKKGYHLAAISYKVEQTKDPGRVHLWIHIQENQKTTVKKIHLSGNRSIKSSRIKAFLHTKEEGLLSWFSSSYGFYDRDVLETDLERIQFLYREEGYWQVQVSRPQVFVSPDRKNVTIHILIEEGPPLYVGQVSLTGGENLKNPVSTNRLLTREGDRLSYSKLHRDRQTIQVQCADEGYAFCNVLPRMAPYGVKDQVYVAFEIQTGTPVNIRRIDIKGNAHSRDKVIRRELRVYEGRLYSERGKEISRQNIKRLGFFDKVEIKTKTIKNHQKLVDLEVEVQDRELTGSLSLGAQYSGYHKLSFNGKVERMNLFGLGQNVGVFADLNLSRQYLSFNFSDPYFLDSRWFFGGDFQLNFWDHERLSGLSACRAYDKNLEKEGRSLKTTQLLKSCRENLPDWRFKSFSEKKVDMGLTFGRSLTDKLSVKGSSRWGYVLIQDDLEEWDSKKSSGFRNPLEVSLEYDSRNDRLFPTRGFYIMGSLEHNGIFSSFNYGTVLANVRFYQELFWGLVFRTNFRYGQRIGLGQENFVPVDEKFRLGGIDSVRGFEYFSIGLRKNSPALVNKVRQYGYKNPEELNFRIYGGLKETLMNVELQIPIFPKARFTGVVFFDAGSVYDHFKKIDPRLSWGLGLRVLTPLGPIRLEWGMPFKPRPQNLETPSRLDFTVGFPF